MITIEQYAAATSSVFAGITLWLAFKTKSLTDMVSEMEKQTRVLVKSYELQNQLTLTERVPYFKSGTFFINQNDFEGYISLVNHGTSARRVFLFGPVNRDINFNGVYIDDIVIKMNVVTFYFTKTKGVRDFIFDFTIKFINEDGIEFFQEFRLSEGIITCYPPSIGTSK
jgi:hypothetical protein